MTDDAIFADPSEPAVLSYGIVALDCPTLQEAVLEWMRLPESSKTQAKIRVKGGAVYDALQIDRLHIAHRGNLMADRYKPRDDSASTLATITIGLGYFQSHRAR
jgi:hypothetical protein